MEKATRSLIRTFGRMRGKKLSGRQQNLLTDILPALLPKESGDILEIGFGNGEYLMRLAADNPDKIIIGAEPFINGVAQLLSKITDETGTILPQYKNIRIWPDDVRKLKHSDFEKIYILHPDPWPKARHEKRRLLSADFLKTLRAKRIIIGTDHTDYYNWIIEQAKLANLKIIDDAMPEIKTKYQQKNMFGSDKTMYLILHVT
jgi:tRNA (guanine-N7-)-methyltransferase